MEQVEQRAEVLQEQQPTEVAEKADRVFTQDEVNKIVQERLERAKTKAETAEQDGRLAKELEEVKALKDKLQADIKRAELTKTFIDNGIAVTDELLAEFDGFTGDIGKVLSALSVKRATSLPKEPKQEQDWHTAGTRAQRRALLKQQLK